jgi:hypothetical protein
MRISVDETIAEVVDIRSQLRRLEQRCRSSLESNFDFYEATLDALQEAGERLHDYLDFWS